MIAAALPADPLFTPIPPLLQLMGTLPEAWAAYGSFTVLTTLTLHSNKFSGGLPDAWRALPALETLNISDAGLGGPLPAWGPDPAKLIWM